MNIEQILAGGFVGAALQQGVSILNNYLNSKREKSKIIFQNKLLRGEKLVGLYTALYFNIRTILAVFKELQALLNDLDLDIDHEGIRATLTTAYQKAILIEDKISDEGFQAYLYYNIKNDDWNDFDFLALFTLGNRLAPKVASFNEMILIDDSSPEFKSLLKDLQMDVKECINSFKGYLLAIESTINQIKDQSK
jgi:hypothetical protein